MNPTRDNPTRSATRTVAVGDDKFRVRAVVTDIMLPGTTLFVVEYVGDKRLWGAPPRDDVHAAIDAAFPEAVGAEVRQSRVGEQTRRVKIIGETVLNKGERLAKQHPSEYILCPKCDGAGSIAGLSHVEDGVCFQCGGDGALKRRSARKNPSHLIPRRNPGISPDALSAVADRIQASRLLNVFGAKEVLVWEAPDRVVLAFRGDALTMELRVLVFERAMLQNRGSSLDVDVQRTVGLNAKAESRYGGVDSPIGQTMDTDDVHVSQVLEGLAKAVSFVINPEDENWESVRATLMPIEGTPWVYGSTETRWYNARTRKWTTSGKPAGLTRVEARNDDGERAMQPGMDFSVVAPKLTSPAGPEYVAGRVGDQVFLVTHALGLDRRGIGVDERAAYVKRSGGILYPSLAVGNVPATIFGSVVFVADPSVILSGMRPYKSRGRWPIVTYTADTWTETTTTFLGDASVELLQQMTGNWEIGPYRELHFYVLGPVVRTDEGPSVFGPKTAPEIVPSTTRLASVLKRRAKAWPRTMTQEQIEAMRTRNDVSHYPYLEAKANGVLGIECFHAVVAPAENRKVATSFLKKVGFKGMAKFVDVDPAPIEDMDSVACWDYGWMVRDAVLKGGLVLDVQEG